MNNKYVLTDECITTLSGAVLHRIKSLKDFGDVKAGMLGGFIEKEENLNIYDNAWVGNNALVYDNAHVCGNARVYGKASVYENSFVDGNAQIYNNARIRGDACVSDNARIYGNAGVRDNTLVYEYAQVYGNACILDSSSIHGSAQVYDNACIRDDAHVYGNAQVYEGAIICGDATIYGNAIIREDSRIIVGSCDSDIHNNLIENIRMQTNLLPVNGEVIAYKQVNKDLSSYYDPNFIYTIGEWAEVSDYDPSSRSCSRGLHFSNPNYWNKAEDVRKSTFLIAKIRLEDIITVQEGKIRCKRAFILGAYNIE